MYHSCPAQLLSSVKGTGASLTEMSSWERPYFDLKLDRATQLSNGPCRSKHSAHHSRLSEVPCLASYVIPTVKKKKYWNFFIGYPIIIAILLNI